MIRIISNHPSVPDLENLFDGGEEIVSIARDGTELFVRVQFFDHVANDDHERFYQLDPDGFVDGTIIAWFTKTIEKMREEVTVR